MVEAKHNETPQPAIGSCAPLPIENGGLDQLLERKMLPTRPAELIAAVVHPCVTGRFFLSDPPLLRRLGESHVLSMQPQYPTAVDGALKAPKSPVNILLVLDLNADANMKCQLTNL